MELRQLKYFVRAAETLNFTKAAEELYITQSTLSQQIKQLEDGLGIPLFERLGKRVRLTEAGGLFLDHARGVLRQATAGQQVLEDLRGLKTGTLVIGATYGLTSLLVKTMAVFAKQCPGVQIRLVFGATDVLLEKLGTGEIDGMLSFMAAAPDVTVTPLFTARLSIVVHHTHALASHRRIALSTLRDWPLALPAHSYSIRGLLDTLVINAGVTLQPKVEVNDIQALLQLADTGTWCTVLMNSSLFNFPGLRAIPIMGEGAKRQATLASPVGVYRKQALVVFSNILSAEASAFRF